jgi:hypothetical protein
MLFKQGRVTNYSKENFFVFWDSFFTSVTFIIRIIGSIIRTIMISLKLTDAGIKVLMKKMCVKSFNLSLFLCQNFFFRLAQLMFFRFLAIEILTFCLF